MNDLLREFVKLAPKEWCASLSPNGWCGWFGNGRRYSALPKNDRASAEALVFLLDWLEGELETVSLTNGWPDDLGGPYCVGWDHDEMGSNERTKGKSRIEAVLRAVVAVLKENQTDPKL